ncbi:MAG: ABC transporter permease [Chloroflexi bacterium]|nr:ABC transporter permease [Chloroflexota bacterium]
MSTYIIRRLLISLPVLLGITIVIFALINLIPGDPATFFISPELMGNDEQVAIVRERLGLNQPLPVRYVKWLSQTVQGDLGFRMKNGDRVASVVWARLKGTVLLVGIALAFGATIGIILGIFTALKQYSAWDYLLTGVSFVGISMPAFVTGIFGLYFLSLKIPLFPAGGMSTVGKPPSPQDTLYHAILPSLLLSFGYLASFMRYTRFSMLEVLHQEYVTTARAKGLTERSVIAVHALRNALLPVVTVIGLSLPNLVVGAVFIETIFSWPGMGTLYLDAVGSRDYPLIMGMNLVTSIVILLTNLATDVAYAFVDPRIRYR